MIPKEEEVIQNGESSTTASSQGNFFVDFVLVGEFSELDGPVPLFVIPDGASQNFNLNEFVVRIMAVDYQNKPTDVTNSAQDTQVVLSEPKEKAFAYIHHFTLLDINARGYVRPICMGFITRDPKKIMNYFTDLMEEFNKVSAILKDGNRGAFLRDLETKIADVMYTQERLLKQDIPSDVNISGTPNTISEIMDDLRQLYKKVTKKDDEQLSPRLDADEDLLLEQSLKNMGYNPKLITSFYKSNYYSSANKNSLRTISDLCGEDVYSKAVSKLRKIQSHFFRPNILLSLEKEDNLALSPSASLLSCGNTVLLNFNIDADRFIRNTDLELKALSPISKSLSKSVSNISFKSSSSNSSSYASPASTMSDPPIIPNEDHDSTTINTTSSTTTNNTSTNSAPISPIVPHISTDLNTSSQHNSVPTITTNNTIYPELYGHSNYEGEDTLSNMSSDSLNVIRMQALMWPKTSPYMSINRVNLESFAGILWGYSKNLYGKGIIEFKTRYSYFKHIIYAILKGRPLIIYAHNTNESLVKKLVTSLAIFVSGHCRKQPSIIPWSTKPLKMSDLSSLKLIGYSKQKPIPKAIEKYVCKLDFESELYFGPIYSNDSKLIEDILSSKKQWPDEDTYLAYIHYLLYDLAIKACQYYHLCCISLPNHSLLIPNNNNNNNIATNNNNNTSNLFLYQTLPTPTTSSVTSNQNNGMNTIPTPNSGSLQMKNSNRYEYDKRSLSDSQLSLKVVSNSISQSREEAKFSFFKRLNYTKCDTEIVEYLAEVVKEQQSLEIHGPDQVTPVIRLDYTPVTQFQNQFKSNIKKPL